MIRHYANLTNGLKCPCFADCECSGVIRIQSTWCEQRQWDRLLMTIGADILYNLAISNRCVIHDVSEKPRIPRSIWQGMEFVRYCCERTWNRSHVKCLSRNGWVMHPYFDKAYQKLQYSTRQYIRYFRKYHEFGDPVLLTGCGFINKMQPQRVKGLVSISDV